MGTNKKLEKSIGETFDKMDGIVNETLKKDGEPTKQSTDQPNNQSDVSGDNKISETPNIETPESNTTGETTDTGTSEETSENSGATLSERTETSKILEEETKSEETKSEETVIPLTETISQFKTVTPPVETVTPPVETVTPPVETVTPPVETVTPPVVTPPVVTPPVVTPPVVTPPVETVTPPPAEFEAEAEYSDMDNLKIFLRQTNNYSYLNCGRHLQNSLDNESLKKFYDEFIVLGCTNDIDYKVLNLIEIILGIKTPFLPK